MSRPRPDANLSPSSPLPRASREEVRRRSTGENGAPGASKEATAGWAILRAQCPFAFNRAPNRIFVVVAAAVLVGGFGGARACRPSSSHHLLVSTDQLTPFVMSSLLCRCLTSLGLQHCERHAKRRKVVCELCSSAVHFFAAMYYLALPLLLFDLT